MTFVNPSPGNRRVSTSSGGGLYQRIGASGSTRDFITSFGGRVSPSVLSFSPNVNVNIGTGSKPSKDGSDGKGGSGGSSKGKSGNRPKRASAFRPLRERDSTNLSYVSGIKSGLLINKTEKNTSNYSTLFISSGSFFPKGNQNSYATNLMSTSLFSDFLMDCQRAVNYKVSSTLTSERFYEYISSVLSGLQLYYFVDSVLAYCNHTSNRERNPGLLAIRSQFTAEILSQHALLGERLRTLPIPKNILDTVRYMYQNFTFLDDPDSPIIRLGFRETLHRGSHIGLSEEYYEIVIDEILNISNVVGSILVKTYPDMLIGELPLSSALPIYDRNFISFWINNSCSYLKGDKVMHSRTVRNRNQEFNYFSMNNDELDGLFSSCLSIFNNETDTYESGIWSPISDVTKFKAFDEDCRSSLLCYNSSESSFVTPKSLDTLSQSGLYHGVYYNEVSDKYLDYVMPPIGSLKVQTANLNMFNQSVSETVYYLYEV